jgi:hypothetical protein
VSQHHICDLRSARNNISHHQRTYPPRSTDVPGAYIDLLDPIKDDSNNSGSALCSVNARRSRCRGWRFERIHKGFFVAKRYLIWSRRVNSGKWGINIDTIMERYPIGTALRGVMDCVLVTKSFFWIKYDDHYTSKDGIGLYFTANTQTSLLIFSHTSFYIVIPE